MNNAEASQQKVNQIPAGNGIRMGMSGQAREFIERQRPCGIDVEIANRLRNLGRESVMVESGECRSRFLSTRMEQVRIRMRLKQVAGLVIG